MRETNHNEALTWAAKQAGPVTVRTPYGYFTITRISARAIIAEPVKNFQ